MEIGGAESSLLGILQALDYSKVQVDLLLLNPNGELMGLIPQKVNILKTPKPYLSLSLPIKVALCNGSVFIVLARLISKLLVKICSHKPSTYIVKQYVHKLSLSFLPKITAAAGAAPEPAVSMMRSACHSGKLHPGAESFPRPGWQSSP